ncbi:MAG: septum formation initiator family protein [Pseudomonadota bacterium]
MGRSRRIPTLGALIFLSTSFLLAGYFTFAALQGDYGLFRRIQIEAEADMLRAELQRLQAEVAAVENKTQRLSDTYLDLDLLDEQARDILGLVRSDEIVVQ